MPALRPLTLTQLINTPTVAGYAIAPDSQMAAVVWDKSGRNEIYLVPLRGAGRPRRLTRGAEAKVAPAFAPTGGALLYAQDHAGDENFDLWVYDFATRAHRNLTPDTPDETINPDAAWSPDGRHVAYVSNRSGRFAAYAQPVDGSAPPRRLTDHPYSDVSVLWAPDGRHLAVCAWTEGQTFGLFIVPTAGGAAVAVGGATGPVDASQAAWARDGRRLAFMSNAPGQAVICIFDLPTGALTQLSPATHEAGEPAWAPDGQTVAYTWNVDGNVSLRLHPVAGGPVRELAVAPGVHARPLFTPDGRQLLRYFDGPRHPSDLWAFDLAQPSRRPRRLTDSRPHTGDMRTLSAPEVVRWPSDGLTISGLLYRPRGLRRGKPGAGRAPAVLWVHGGPTWQYKNEWWAVPQALAAAGCVVLAPNYRGSSGYGRAFQEANRFDLGGGDMRDVIAGAQFLVAGGYADPRRIAITGSSYGGYLTVTALTRHPQVFAAGAAVVPFLNWFTEHASEREDLQYWDEQNFGHPERDADRYRFFSPIFHMEHITAPVQLLAGENDPRCPAAETAQAAAALKDLDVPHEVVIYPGEGHAFLQRATRLDAARRRVRFILKHLNVSPAKP